MQKEEFEKLAGVHISEELWGEVQRVFAAAGASDWEAFTKSYIDMGRPGWELCKGLTFMVENLRAATESYMRKDAELHDSIALALLRASAEHKDKDLFDVAVSLVGMRDAVVLGLDAGLVLPAEAVVYVKENLG